MSERSGTLHTIGIGGGIILVHLLAVGGVGVEIGAAVLGITPNFISGEGNLCQCAVHSLKGTCAAEVLGELLCPDPMHPLSL